MDQILALNNFPQTDNKYIFVLLNDLAAIMRVLVFLHVLSLCESIMSSSKNKATLCVGYEYLLRTPYVFHFGFATWSYVVVYVTKLARFSHN